MIYHQFILQLVFRGNFPVTRRLRRSYRRIHYYPNSMASFQLLLSGDIELNPGSDSDSSSQQKNKQQRTSRPFLQFVQNVGKLSEEIKKDLYVMYAKILFMQVVSESPIRTTSKFQSTTMLVMP